MDGGEPFLALGLVVAGDHPSILSPPPQPSSMVGTPSLSLRLSIDTHGTHMANSPATTMEEEEDGSARKKLRLTKEQSALLEDRFKEQNTLNPKQKQALAKQLNLRPRQVEVWFQNRRARTKLKQTEVECELLKKCCETLTEENQRLKKEFQELKSLKQQPSHLTICPSCQNVATTSAATTAATSSPEQRSKPVFPNPFSNPAAC